jgi:hypothetical protein
MLVDLQKYSAESLKKPIVRQETLVEVEIPSGLRKALSAQLLSNGFEINRHSSFAVTSEKDNNFAVMPNQFFRFAVELYYFAFEVKKYFDILDQLRGKPDLLLGNAEEIAASIERDPDFKEKIIGNDLYLFSNFIESVSKYNEFRLRGKSAINIKEKEKAPEKESRINVRTSEDCFGSVMLTQINLPNSSSGIFGDLVYALVNKKDLFDELKIFYEKTSSQEKNTNIYSLRLPKPFLLLAGISGTGKSRFVQEQARLERPDLSNYLNIPVRPDWHEPSDLLGYVSQIGGERYIATHFLVFIVAAWRAAISFADATRFELKPLNEIHTFWCCLDEMNLAPVEQYLADYLSVSENRQWQDGQYICTARNTLIPSGLLQRLKNNTELRTQLGLLSTDEGLWQYFLANGIPLPPNLIVAGTVNMDETTHGFSRKVIDRAFTIDFGKFFPNVVDDFFKPKTINKALSFPTLSSATLEDLAAIEIDADGQKTIAFIKAMNQRLVDTPFELAYRALNELLLAVICFAPKSEAELQAVWDDFLMSKLLPRIDGDKDKLKILKTNSSTDTDASLLTDLQTILATQMHLIWNTPRIDLLRNTTDGKEIPIKCRSKDKLEWMNDRLATNSFTSFWP